MATIHDVARKAAVSVGTVSNAINAPNKLNPRTLSRVVAAIDELGFVPKVEATLRARKRAGRIGVVGTFSVYASFHQRLIGVLGAVEGLPFEVTVYDQKSPKDIRDDHLTRLPIKGHLDGLIVFSLMLENPSLERLLRHGLETVFVECRDSRFSSVEVDNFDGGRLAAEHLLARGRRRLAFVGERQFALSKLVPSSRRLVGFRDVLEQAGVGLPDRYISLGVYGVEEARAQAHELLDLPIPPDAVFAFSDLQAVGVLKAAKDRGLRVPDDMAVIGFDDLDLADYVGLTTVRQPLAESGKVAVKLLLERLADPTALVQKIRLPASVVERSTT